MAIDYFLKVESAPGECKKTGHVDEIDIESFSWGATNTGTHAFGGGGGSGKVQMQDFHFTMRINKATPVLFLRCCDGKHLKSAILTCRKAGEKQQTFLKICMTDLIVSSYQSGGSNGSDDIPMESIAINFAKVEFIYSEQKPDGSVTPGTPVGFDQKTGEKV